MKGTKARLKMPKMMYIPQPEMSATSCRVLTDVVDAGRSDLQQDEIEQPLESDSQTIVSHCSLPTLTRRLWISN